MELYRSWNPSMTESSAKGQPLGLLKLKSAGCRRTADALLGPIRAGAAELGCDSTNQAAQTRPSSPPD